MHYHETTQTEYWRKKTVSIRFAEWCMPGESNCESGTNGASESERNECDEKKFKTPIVIITMWERAKSFQPHQNEMNWNSLKLKSSPLYVCVEYTLANIYNE